MIPFIEPEDILERGREFAELYRPKLEEMFDVDLSALRVKPVDELPIDYEEYVRLEFLTHPDYSNEWEIEGLIEEQVRSVCDKMIEKVMEIGNAHYLSYSDSMYLGGDEQIPEISLARIVVHEMCHGISSRIPEISGVNQNLSIYVEEGFAEYVSLALFIDSYGLDAVHLEQRAVYEQHTKVLEASNDQISNMDDDSWLDGPNHELFEPHAWGLAFMVKVVNAGVDPVDVLKNPPIEFLDILVPDTYIKKLAAQP